MLSLGAPDVTVLCKGTIEVLHGGVQVNPFWTAGEKGKGGCVETESVLADFKVI